MAIGLNGVSHETGDRNQCKNLLNKALETAKMEQWRSSVVLCTPNYPSAGCTYSYSHRGMWETADPRPDSQTPAPLCFVFPHKTLKGLISLGSIKAIIDNKQGNFLSQNSQFNS